MVLEMTVNKRLDKEIMIESTEENLNETIQEKDRMNYIERELMDIFLSVGIPAHLQGYHYLKEAIKLVVGSAEFINNVTKRLYPKVAELFETTSTRVERGIRHAIEVACCKGKMIHINKIFGLDIYSKDDRPTNSEFIALVADKLNLELK